MFQKRTRKPLTPGERSHMDQLVAEGRTNKEIGEILGRPAGTIGWNLRNSVPRIPGTPNACQCGRELRQTTDNGYRVESCPQGCVLAPDVGYLVEFRVR